MGVGWPGSNDWKLFRALINDESRLFIVDNLSAIPILAICLSLAISKNRIIHKLFMNLLINYLNSS